MTQIILPDSPSSVLQLLNADKKALEKFANSIIQDVKEGRENPLEIHLLIKKYEFVLDLIKHVIKENVNTEVAKYGEKSFEYGSAHIHYTPTATSYDFTVCKDNYWNEKTNQIAFCKMEIKIREDFLKTLKEPITVVDPETGETNTIYPPHKGQVHGLKVTLK